MSENSKSNRGRKRCLTDSARKRNRATVASKWNKSKVYIGNQFERWNELKAILNVDTHAEVANVFLNKSHTRVLINVCLSLFVFYSNHSLCRRDTQIDTIHKLFFKNIADKKEAKLQEKYLLALYDMHSDIRGLRRGNKNLYTHVYNSYISLFLI